MSAPPQKLAAILRNRVAPTPTISIVANAPAGQLEGNAGDVRTFPFLVALNRRAVTPVTGTVRVTPRQPQPALAADFQGGAFPAVAFTIPAGERLTVVNLTTVGNTTYQPDRAFDAVLENVTGATVLLGTAAGLIRDDDDEPAPPLPDDPVVTVAIPQGNAQYEGATFAFVVTRDGAPEVLAVSATVDYVVEGRGLAPARDADFVGGARPTGTVTFAPGATTATVSVATVDNAAVTGDRAFRLRLLNPVNMVLGATFAADATILDRVPLPPDPGDAVYGPTVFASTELPRVRYEPEYVPTVDTAGKPVVRIVANEAELRQAIRDHARLNLGLTIVGAKGFDITVADKIPIPAVNAVVYDQIKWCTIRSWDKHQGTFRRRKGQRVRWEGATHDRDQLMVIRTTNRTDGVFNSTESAFASRYRFEGVAMLAGGTSTAVQRYLTNMGDTDPQTQLAQMPREWAFQHCVWAGPNPDASKSPYAIPGFKGIGRAFAYNAGELHISDSQFLNIGSSSPDSNAIAGNNGTGPLTLRNTQLRGGGIPLIFGGDVSHIGRLYEDVTIDGCDFEWPLEWLPKHPRYLGNPAFGGTDRGIKNKLEFKGARRVVVQGCVFRGGRVDGQPGYFWTPKSSVESGTSGRFQYGTAHAVFRGNVGLNLSCGPSFSISEAPDHVPSWPNLNAAKALSYVAPFIASDAEVAFTTTSRPRLWAAPFDIRICYRRADGTYLPQIGLGRLDAFVNLDRDAAGPVKAKITQGMYGTPAQNWPEVAGARLCVEPVVFTDGVKDLAHHKVGRIRDGGAGVYFPMHHIEHTHNLLVFASSAVVGTGTFYFQFGQGIPQDADLGAGFYAYEHNTHVQIAPGGVKYASNVSRGFAFANPVRIRANVLDATANQGLQGSPGDGAPNGALSWKAINAEAEGNLFGVAAQAFNIPLNRADFLAAGYTAQAALPSRFAQTPEQLFHDKAAVIAGAADGFVDQNDPAVLLALLDQLRVSDAYAGEADPPGFSPAMLQRCVYALTGEFPEAA